MAFRTQTSSAVLIRGARVDASRSIARWRWITFGVILSIVPIFNIVLLGISTIVLNVVTPTIDLSTPQRQAIYFENPARYTLEYRRTAKRLRCMRTFYGWLAGAIIFNLF